VLDFPLARQVPPQNILEDIRPQIADVNEVVNGRAAGVHSNRFPVLWFEDFLFTGESVGQF
jgi:hypothetical protein